MKKRILSIVLVLCMVLSFVPITVFAANSDTTAELQALLDAGGTVTTEEELINAVAAAKSGD